jgi:radical SAM protein with 4Fe4S-binding SPASM domain
MEPPERVKEFHRKLSTGWEAGYTEYRRLWQELPARRELRDYPLLVDLELSSVCNLKCKMCYTITDEFKQKVKKGLMDWELYTKIIDEIAGKVFALRLSLRGEATLHKRFVDCVRYAKEKGIPEVSVLTHGGKLEQPFFESIVEAGIDWISISIDGLKESYDPIRKPLKFEDALRRIREMKAYKDARGLVKPVIKIQGIWPAIRPNPTEYYETFAPYVDLVAYNPLIDYLRKDKEIVYEDNFACPQLYQRIVIGSNGNVMMCSNDEDEQQEIGDAYTQSIHEIWHSEKLQRVRDFHNQKDGFKQVHVCTQCYYPRKAVPDEQAKVGRRIIYIENYINRPQVAGT